MLTVDLRPCLGPRESVDQSDSCRAHLLGALGDGPLNACLLIFEPNELGDASTTHLALTWDGRALAPAFDDAAVLAAGPEQPIRAELYFVGDRFDAALCREGGIELGAACDAERDCVFKMAQDEITIDASGARAIQFHRESSPGCDVAWGAGYEAPEELDDGMDNDCDRRVDEDD